MKVLALLVCVWCLGWRTNAESKSYVITAPLSLHLDAVETVFVQLFGYTSEVPVYVFLRTSMAVNNKVLFQDVVRLNSLNGYQGVANVRLFPNKLGKDVNQVVLHVQTSDINQHQPIPISRTNGFLFIQTDKPLYTPNQKVKVRAFSMNQELRPANRSVFLTFKDPEQVPVDVVEMIDVNNGIPSMQNPFKIPVKPKLGIWTIEAAYSDDFNTKATTDFEVKEYVLPSFSILMNPQTNHISFSEFRRFTFRISARYLHGAPVTEGLVYLRYGYVRGTGAPVIIPKSFSQERLSQTGEVDVTVDMQTVLQKHDGPKDISSLVGSYLYIAVLVKEDTGGITQEAEFASVKFVRSPYHLSLISTPPFIKPGLPYNIKVLVKDHLDKPMSKVSVQLTEKQLVMNGGSTVDMSCQGSGDSSSDGLVYFICHPLKNSARAVLKFQTADPTLPSSSQASLTLEPVAYQSPNQRYLYIDTPMFGRSLEVGRYTNIHVYTATPSYLNIRTLNYLVLSKGKVVYFRTLNFVNTSDNKQTLNFQVTSSMVPSIRLLVYYVLHGEGTTELVADSVWMDVKDKCLNGLQMDVSLRSETHKPKDNVNLDIRANQDGLVALSAVDSALFTLRPYYKDPVFTVLRHIEKTDQGCGGGGGKNNADVFRLAGLTFMTNANAHPLSSTEPCTAVVRPKRALSQEEINNKARRYGRFKTCCERGMDYIPKSVTCERYAQQRLRSKPPADCIKAFRECCEFFQQSQDQNDVLVLARTALGANFDLAPMVRSYFPESWLWEVQRTSSGQLPIRKSLPDSLTTWQIKAVGMFQNGMCVADPVEVSVNLPLSVDVPLPYQVVRGEQVELRGSVYNQKEDSITYCVTLTAGPALCLLQSHPVNDAGLHSTTCTFRHLLAGGVGVVNFTVLGLEPGEHTLTFTLKTRAGVADVVEKLLRVVPEGVRQEVNFGGILDPQGLYGSEKRTVVLKNRLPENIVPKSDVERLLTINGELPGDVATVLLNPEDLKQLISLPPGSAEAELQGLLPLIQVYQYLETTGSWDVLGGDVGKMSGDLRQKIKEGLVAISSFRNGDSSYSMWIKSEPSTIVTAEMIRALSMADAFLSVDHQSLSDSVGWLIRRTQKEDGSFAEKSSSRLIQILGGGEEEVEQSVFVTSVALIALHRATSIRDQILRLRSHEASKRSAANYISQHALSVRSVYVRALATYALTLQDSNSEEVSQLITSLEGLARQKGNPVTLRYWQESSVTTDWLKPDKSSGQTVETTAYVLLTMLLKARISYANPILAWLTQDQHYGGGFFSIKDAVLTLEALTLYKSVMTRSVLNQEINIRYKVKGPLGRVSLSQTRPVATPIQVTKNDDITVTTGYGRGVSSVKLKTVFYQTTASTQPRCNFDLTIEVVGPSVSDNPSMKAPHLVACVKYRPPPNEVATESSLAVMKIQLPTGVEPYLEDLRQFRDDEESLVSHYELQGSTVIIQMDWVPSQVFVCVGFRVRTGFKVVGATESWISVTEPQEKGSLCSKQFSSEQQKLQRLCVDHQCQCMTAACASYRGTTTNTLTLEKRIEEICKEQIKFAYKLTVTSSAAEGDFMTYTATVDQVLRPSNEFEAVSSGTEVDLVKKATCSSVDLHDNRQYLVMGSSGSEVTHNNGFRSVPPWSVDVLVSRGADGFWSISGTGFLWTLMPWWSSGLRVALQSVRTTFPRWRN
ncbi:transcript variant X1 [Nothobranchius furzeri]|uniref:Transcript variant X1 n=1 Tax=Nothobranchius furzeri TaxID=105023 RepID=A0A9D3BF34_NOTFU|nr:transcript variant X1 [Nothobranchius furzeri]